MASKRALAELRRFTSCDIGDALVKLKYPFGGFLDGIALRAPGPETRVFGPAVTIQMVEISDESAPKLDKHFVDHNEEGSVMYIQQPKGLYSACWGGLMTTRAKYLKAEGVIVDGRIRDVNEHIEFGFPVFSAGTSILGSNTFTRASRVNVPLQFKGDLWINPGDIMVGDADGVVVTPPSLIEEVVAICQERAEIDEKMFAELRKGAAMGPLIKALRKGKGA
ncbi:ribonuclease E inhibitor RraA/Dimethylmenaquinone methyltransferase [Xylariales sp. PMI_506]|nr:ribonuclease E inhibitor RraA/Dimethylmenaquinone methyltransferase [Xylariales sp. PMI_506]